MFKHYATILLLPLLLALKPAVTVAAADTPAANYIYEDFENGTPEDWDLGLFYLAPWGIDGSQAIANDSYYGDGIIVTPSVSMGDNPYLTFMYQVYTSAFGSVGEMSEANPQQVKFYIEVTEDEGATWQKVYSIAPESGDMTHVVSPDFTEINIPLTQYAGKTCKVRITQPYFWDLTTFEYCRYIFDNFFIGTKPNTDLAVTGLSGTAFPTVNTLNSYTATVHNKADNDNASYTIRLVDKDNNELATVAAKNVAAGDNVSVTFDWTPTTTGTNTIKAIIETEGDSDLSNNETPWMHIDVVDSQTKKTAVGMAGDRATVQLPVNLYSRSNYNQVIYKAQNFALGMAIRGVSYDTQFANAIQTCDFKVYIGETDKENFDDKEWIDFASLTQVFDGSVYVDPSTQLMQIAFDQPYKYKGGNLVVCVWRQDKDFYNSQLYPVDENSQFKGAAMTCESDSEPVTPETPGMTVCDYIPVTTFIVDVAPTGTVSGTVTGKDGIALSDATISVNGTSINTTTDANGNYIINNQLTEGSYTLKCTAYGYERCETDVTVVADETTIANIVLQNLPKYTVSGTVKNSAGVPMTNATVQLLGYCNRKVYTDDSGNFTVTNVLADGSTYALRIGAPYFKTYEQELEVTNDINGLNFTLEEHLDMPYNVVATQEQDTLTLSWQTPLNMVRYDAPDQDVIGHIGFYGWYNSVLGTAFKHNMKLHEIHWFLSDEIQPHPIVNIWIYELDETGWPTYYREIVKLNNVPNTDNQWSVYKFDTPLEIPQGCYIGLNSGDRGVDVCMSAGTTEYPVVAGRYFGSDDVTFQWDDMHSRFADLTTAYDANLLIRVVGEDYGEVDFNTYTEDIATATTTETGRPNSTLISYDIYRVNENEELTAEAIVGKGITDTQFTDKTFAGLPQGTTVKYAVVANYASGQSSPTWSETIVKTSTGINGAKPTNPVVEIRVVGADGTVVYDGSPALWDENNTSGGIYVVGKKYADGNVTYQKLIIRK